MSDYRNLSQDMRDCIVLLQKVFYDIHRITRETPVAETSDILSLEFNKFIDQGMSAADLKIQIQGTLDVFLS
jgi:hypothetical protein